MSASLRSLCAKAPLAIRQPPPGSPLLAVCKAADAAPWPKGLDGFMDAARKIVDRHPRRTDLPPLASKLAYANDVLRYANGLMALRIWQHAERQSPDRHEGLAMFFTTYVFLVCGGRLGEGDRMRACETAAEYLGVAASDVAGAVSTYTAATCQLMHDAAYLRQGVHSAELLSACLRAASDLFVEHHGLLDHTRANARLAAEIAADHDARYQPPVEDLEYARS